MDQNVRKFEYRLQTVIVPQDERPASRETQLEIEIELNTWGNDSWELVQQIAKNVDTRIFVWRIWKRELA